MYICMYIYIYIYTYIHTYIHTYYSINYCMSYNMCPYLSNIMSYLYSHLWSWSMMGSWGLIEKGWQKHGENWRSSEFPWPKDANHLQLGLMKPYFHLGLWGIPQSAEDGNSILSRSERKNHLQNVHDACYSWHSALFDWFIMWQTNIAVESHHPY